MCFQYDILLFVHLRMNMSTTVKDEIDKKKFFYGKNWATSNFSSDCNFCSLSFFYDQKTKNKTKTKTTVLHT